MSTLRVTTVTSPDANTDLILASGNNQSGQILISANGAGVTLKANSTVNAITINTTSWTFSNNPVFSTNTFTVGTAAYFVANGNVGIGNTAPVTKLHITSDSAGGDLIRLTSSNSFGTSMIFMSSSTNGRNYRIGSNYVSGAGEFSIYDSTAAAERVRISANGNVGINYLNMDALNARLYCYGYSGFGASNNGSISLGSRLNWTSTFENFSGGYGLGINVNAANGLVRLQSQRFDGTATAYDMALQDLGGNTGIGTTTPFSKLDVSGTGGYWLNANNFTSNPLSITITSTVPGGYDPVLLFRQSDSAGTIKIAGGIGMVGASNWASASIGNQISDMYFLVRNSSDGYSERMRINSSGNVGIGTSSPSARLNVRGGRTYLEAASEPYSLYVAHNSATSGVFLGGTSTGGLQISNAGGGAWVNIDSSGRVTMPFMPAFWAVGSGTQSWSGAATYTKVNFASGAQYVTSNKSAGWSQANSRYTAPVGGTYEFMLSFAVQTGPSTGPAALLYKNGSAWLEVVINYASTSYVQATGTVMLDLNANDFVEFWIVNYNNTSFTIDLGRCKFSGKLIG